MEKDDKILICGAGGFIGGHLIAYLKKQGFNNIQAVDSKPLETWCQIDPEVDILVTDLKTEDACNAVVKDMHCIFNLAADMGGMGFIEKNKALCMLNVLINTHLLCAARKYQIKEFFFASSACVYAEEKQRTADVAPLKEVDAYPAMPEDGYGWEKLFSERMCRHFYEDFGLGVRIARFHNIYGPFGTYYGGREKAPAAISRKIAEAKISGKREIEIWGDGRQTRSFTFIDDCLEGIRLLMESDFHDPINIGSNELVTINELTDIVEEHAGTQLNRRYNLNAPKGVNGRNSDNTLVRKVLNWEPGTTLRDGMKKTYEWVYNEIIAHGIPS